MMASVFSISLGAALGALLRWKLGGWLNALWPAVPPGTLAANLVGGYLIGLAVAFFAGNPQLSPEWRLLIVTGFLGGLTTFSTFSAEVVANLQRGDLVMAFTGIAVHVAGSLVLTLLGIASYTAFKSLATGG